jgi:energy-coupling factor transporter ATP-binding protein EcfA2
MDYSQFQDRPQAWYLNGFTPARINLIVGKNATGKSRTLNIIGNLANLLSGDTKLTFDSGNYDITFEKDGIPVRYYLAYEKAKILKEVLIFDQAEPVLNRGPGGEGKIFAAKLNQHIDFQTPEGELASLSRRDSIQHPFFEDLYEWGKSLRHYYFGSALGQHHLLVPFKDPSKVFNPKATDEVANFLRRGVDKYGKQMTDPILTDMKLIGYSLDEIGIAPIPGVVVKGIIPVPELLGLYVKESDLKDRTYQAEMSQGMFRALSLLIQLNLSHLEGTANCILIDDIGEGLDFERSVSLIKILIDKALNSSIQLIMSTNDRFVMNNVPLEYWSVIQRVGGKCRIFNYANSRKLFEEFEFTGLSNFDFLSSEFYLKGFDEA